MGKRNCLAAADARIAGVDSLITLVCPCRSKLRLEACNAIRLRGFGHEDRCKSHSFVVPIEPDATEGIGARCIARHVVFCR